MESNYWKRVSRKRLSRRAVLGAGAATALGAAAAVVVGCGSDNGDGTGRTPRPSPGAPGSPVPGGTITWGRAVNVLGIDPHIDLTGLDIDFLLYSYLYSWNGIEEELILNNLALEFEQPDPEHLEFIFTLRPGVKVHPAGPVPGAEITSEDCKQSFIRRGTSITAPDKRFPRKIAGSASKDDLEASLLTPEPHIFRFTMKEPFVPAIREMANPTWAIVPAGVLAEYNSLSQVAFGSGPFMLEEFRGSERIVLRKHPDYFLAPRPWLDGITYIVITDNSSLLSAFKSGQHDINGSVLNKADAEDLQRNENIVVVKNPSLFYPVIHFKIKPPFDDIRVREAVDRALDRDEIIDVIQDGEGNYNGPIQWPQVNWALPQDELREFYKYQPERSKQLLEAAGLPDGFEVRMKLPKLTGPNIVGKLASVIKDQLSRVGIRVQLDEVELGAFIGSTLLPGNFDMAFFPNLPYDEPDRPLSFYHSLGVTGNGSWNNYSNKELDALIEAQAREFDVERRREIIYEAQRMILREHGPQIALTGGFQYQARWNHVHFPFELGQEPPDDVGPFGADIWRDA